MSNREKINFFANWVSFLGVAFLIYQRHYVVTPGGTIGIFIGFASVILVLKKYKEIKDWVLEKKLRLKSNGDRVKAPRHPIPFWAWKWLPKVGIPFGVYYIMNYAKYNSDKVIDTFMLISIVLGVGAVLSLLSLFVAHGD
jgi:hypothetical protein